jgi:hypothetical protein
MSLFVTSKSSATRHGVFAIKATPPSQIRATGTSRVAIVGSFPWGPKDTLMQPASLAELKQLVAPRGFTRTGYAYLALLCMAFPDIVAVRALGSTASKASKSISDVVPTAIITVTAKYEGTGINSAVITVAAATDGNANHFNLSVSISSASGDTTDLCENVNYSGTGADSVFTAADIARLQLIAPPTKLAAGRPLNGTYAFTTAGTDGTINAAAYVGTAGSGDKGIAILETDPNVRHVFCDYPGSGAIAAVDAGLLAHQALMGDRCVYVNGVPAQSASAVQADVASYRGAGVAYVDPWAYVYDDTTQAEQLVPPAVFAAGLAAQLAPSTSIAWKAAEVQRALGAIVRLETPRGMAAATNSALGITTLVAGPKGGFVFEASPNTISVTDPTQAELTTTRMDQYIAESFVTSVYGRVDAPNVASNRDDLAMALEGFMSTLKANAGRDPDHNVHVINYQILPLDSANTPQDFAAGDVSIPLSVQYSNGMKRIFLILKSGTAPLTVTAQ